MIKVTPLSSGFFLASIIGFFIGIFVIYPTSASWGFTISLIFVLMFIASTISLTYSSVDDYMMDEEKKKRKMQR